MTVGSCFTCLASFPVAQVTTWTDDDTTAICPHCGIDSVIPSSDLSLVPRLTGWEILSSMKEHWFGKGRPISLETVDIASLQYRSHATASRKGFWDTRAGGQRPSMGEKLMLVCCEVAEAMEELRKQDVDPSKTYYVDGKPEGFGIELADAVIRILDVAQEAGVDMASCILEKEAYNLTRPHMHGRKL